MALYEDTEDKLISEFNEAKYQIYRLHNIWTECKFLRERGKLMQVRWKLDSAAIELWDDAMRLDEGKDKKDEKEKYTSKILNLDKEISDAVKAKNIELFYTKLMEKEILLRKLQNESGKGSKYGLAEEEF